jgi:hypothetical protein
MSWLFSQALVVEYLGDISSDGEQSVQLNGSNTQQAYCAPDKMTDFCRISQFGMMFKPLTENLGKELLMSYLGDFPVKTYQQPGGGWDHRRKKFNVETHGSYRLRSTTKIRVRGKLSNAHF